MRRVAAAAIGLWLLAILPALAQARLTPPEGLLRAYGEVADTLTWSEYVQRLAVADVVLLGEQHEDPATHRLELATLQALHQRLAGKRPLVLSLEMFETDVQQALDAHLRGGLSEPVFRLATRPWPNYDQDYKPLIEYARAQGIPVVAANVPRPIAADVAKKGLAALDDLPEHKARWVARPAACDRGAAWRRFEAVMAHHPGIDATGRWRMYEAQCVKDATMARAIAQALAQDRPLVLHVQGAFHSDYGQGVPAELRRRLPEGATLRVVTAVPVGDDVPERPPADLADIVVYVRAPQPH